MEAPRTAAPPSAVLTPSIRVLRWIRVMGVEDGAYQVQDVQRFRVDPAEVEVRVRSQAEIDGPNVQVCIEQEPGSAGATNADTLV